MYVKHSAIAVENVVVLNTVYIVVHDDSLRRFDTISNCEIQCVFSLLQMALDEVESVREGKINKRTKAEARIQSTERNCSWHWNCWEKCVSKAMYYCRILIDIDFCSIIKFQLMHTVRDEYTRQISSVNSRSRSPREKQRSRKREKNDLRCISRALSITCRIIIIIFIIVQHVSFLFLSSTSATAKRRLQFVIVCCCSTVIMQIDKMECNCKIDGILIISNTSVPFHVNVILILFPFQFIDEQREEKTIECC